jgi:hypothetical protein
VALAAAIAAACIPAAALGASGEPANSSVKPWAPQVGKTIAYARHRRARSIAFAVVTPSHFWGWHATQTFFSASLLKPMLLAAYLRRDSVRNRSLRSSERGTLTPMIERSDNAAAGRILGIVGKSGLRALARRAGMHHFTPVTPVWGKSRINASDQAHFFLQIDRLIPARHRAYAMHLLASIVPSQRWGIGRVSPRGWHLYFKGGWGSGTGWVDHQTALLTRGHERVALSILTYLDPNHSYGKETLRGMAKRLLAGLDTAKLVK